MRYATALLIGNLNLFEIKVFLLYKVFIYRMMIVFGVKRDNYKYNCFSGLSCKFRCKFHFVVDRLEPEMGSSFMDSVRFILIVL